MIVVPYQAEHFERLRIQDAQAKEYLAVSGAQAKALENEYAFTALDGEVVLGCGGLYEINQCRGLVWAYVGSEAGKHFTAIHRAVKSFLDIAPHPRIEADVAYDFAPGHRWIKLLGFELETACRKNFFPDGGAAACYVRLR